MAEIKTRFCPSPTGMMHIGNARTALFNALFARQQNGIFLLRIEDTDATRSTEASAHQLMEDLQWLKLDWQEGPGHEKDAGPYWQSQRQSIYDRYYEQLIQAGKAYPCFCSEQTLAMMRRVQQSSGLPPRYVGTCRNLSNEEVANKIKNGEHPTLRFRVPDQTTVEFEDLVRGTQRFNSDDLGDFIIRRADGTSPFMFCNAIDDALMGVTHALRGEDHLTNTPRQVLIYEALGLRAPAYGHISLIVGSDNSPLSKRHGSRSISVLREEGFLAIALLNYLARLGHYYAENRLMSMSELFQAFNLEMLGSAPAHYDEAQMLHWQREAVLSLSPEAFWKWLPDDIQALIPESSRASFIDLIHGNVLFPKEVGAWAEVLFNDTIAYDETAHSELSKVPSSFFELSIETLTKEYSLAALKKALSDQLQLKGKALFLPIRMTLTGQAHGPELEPLFNLLGLDRCVARFRAALSLK